jgi:hypothetical protein
LLDEEKQRKQFSRNATSAPAQVCGLSVGGEGAVVAMFAMFLLTVCGVFSKVREQL